MKVVDTFSRTVSNGWGTSDSGHQWVIESGAPSQFSVGNGVGKISFPTDVTGVLLVDGVKMKDLDAEFKVRIFPVGQASRLISFIFRLELTDDTTHALFVDFYRLASNTWLGLMLLHPDGLGDTLDLTTVSGINPESHQCTLRVLAEGNRVRVKAWNSAQSEPSEWHIDYIDNDIDIPGKELGVLAIGDGGDSTEFDDLSITSLDPSPLKVRIGNEWVAATPHVRRNGVWVPTNVSALAA